MKKLVKFALLIGAVAVAAKLAAAKKTDWHGLTEAEVRAKLDSRLPDRVPDDKRAAVADKVVAKMRERGVLHDDVEPTASADAGGDDAEARDDGTASA